MRIGVLTSGGDCPGLNAVIRSAVLHGTMTFDDELVGIRNGWLGLLQKDVVELNRASVRGLAGTGGTILGTSRTHPFNHPDGGMDVIRANMAELKLDGLMVIGGEGTLAGAHEMALAGIPLIGIPKTIDNDLRGTDMTFGFDTAVSIATDAMDRLRTTGEAHHRVMVAEVMGRNVGWIGLNAGISAGAHAILIPEIPTSLAQLYTWIQRVHDQSRSPLVVVSEGYVPEGMEKQFATGEDDEGRPILGGVGDWIRQRIEADTGIETRNTVLGHIQRGGTPTGLDRVLSTRFGIAGIELLHAGGFDRMVSLQGTEIKDVALTEALDGLNTVPEHRYREVEVLFGR